MWVEALVFRQEEEEEEEEEEEVGRGRRSNERRRKKEENENEGGSTDDSNIPAAAKGNNLRSEDNRDRKSGLRPGPGPDGRLQLNGTRWTLGSRTGPNAVTIKGSLVDVVEEHKYLDVHRDKLDWWKLIGRRLVSMHENRATELRSSWRPGRFISLCPLLIVILPETSSRHLGLKITSSSKETTKSAAGSQQRDTALWNPGTTTPEPAPRHLDHIQKHSSCFRPELKSRSVPDMFLTCS
ncbi:unnamed protein product [Pleuronectes platessa]|uniref:Uncharacterized protein n=1 Tax=Pleuronectes platessa TaxID=8262 RepID=A0A9N7Y8H1_PLEPL|nr:unnamed protein product [Pleuronectes platessa]